LVIWRLPASITDSVTALIAMIDATKASFVLGGSGSGIFCDAPPILLLSPGVYPSRNRRMDGASRSDSKYTFRSQKKCRGESGELLVWDADSGERHSSWGAGNSAWVGHPGVGFALTGAPRGRRRDMCGRHGITAGNGGW